MPRAWAKLDCFYYRDAELQAAASEAGSIVFGLFPMLLADAKAQNNGGAVEFTYRDLAHALYEDAEVVLAGIRALLSAGVLSCPVESENGATLHFDPDAWRRWNDAARKAQKRQEQFA